MQLYIIIISAITGVILAREVFGLGGLFEAVPRWFLLRKYAKVAKLLTCPVCWAGWLCLGRCLFVGLYWHALDAMFCAMLLGAIITALIYGRK